MVSFNSFTNDKITKRLRNVSNVENVQCAVGLSYLMRCFLAFLNSFPLMFSFIVLAAGSGTPWYYSAKDWPTTVDALTISLGLIIGITAFLGFVGSVTESVRLLKWYTLTLVTISVTLFILSNIFYVALVNHLIQPNTVVQNILGFIYEYSNNYYLLHVIVGALQYGSRCCGFSGPQSMVYDHFDNKTMVYDTCCTSVDSDGLCLIENAYQKSCASVVDYNTRPILDMVYKLCLMLCPFPLIIAALGYFVLQTAKRRTIKYEKIPEVSTINSK